MDELSAFMEHVIKLKGTKRKGWLLRGISSCESVADHSYGVSMLVLIMSRKMKIDSEKAIMMALIHDFSESIVGDITPHDNVDNKRKLKMEFDAISEISKASGIKELSGLWLEYSENKTREAKLVRDMDKIDMIFQALEYERKYGKDLAEFFNYVKDKLELSESKEFYERIVKQRKK